jgi:hypothetical protein
MEATPEQMAEGVVICRVLATVLDRLIQANRTLARVDPGQVTRFHAMKAPGIGIQQYLERYVSVCENLTLVTVLSHRLTRNLQSHIITTQHSQVRIVLQRVLCARVDLY